MISAAPENHPAPLETLRVLDCATGPLGAIGRTLAELGAYVVRVEPRSGAPDRAQAPCVDGHSLAYAAANLGKRAIALDLGDADDRASFDALAATADIVIETTAPGAPAALALDAARLHRAHPALVILSASPFGATGSHAGWHATDPVLHALSGELSRSGIPGRVPLLPPGELATQCAVTQAVFVILLAYVNRLCTGRGDHLDFSVLEAASQALDPGYGIAGSAANGVPASQLPRGRMEARQNYPIIPCADGHVRLCVLSPRQWQGMFDWLGRPAAFADPAYGQLQVRFADPTLVPAIARFFADKTRQELEAAGQRHGVPTAALLTLSDVLASDQIAARGALQDVQIAPGMTAQLPNGVMEIDGARMGIRGRAPGLDEHGPDLSAILARWRAMPAPPRLPSASDRPLAGLTVLDFGVIVVGAEQGRLLADQGASVEKIESAAFPDGARQDRRGGLIAPTFAAGHFNKRSFGVNLRDPRGRDLLLQLADQADIILSNFKPGTLASLGLDYAALSARNPRIIMVDSSAFGPTGPWSTRLGYGPLVRASTGLTDQWGYAGEADSFSDAMTVYPDHAAARIGAAAALALLIRRARTGQGGTASIAQNEVMLSHMPAQIAAATPGVATASAPRDAPWGVFPCAGDDEWCVVTVRDTDDWQALCVAIGRPDFAVDPALATPAGRNAARDRIDQAVAAWLSGHDSRHAMRTLQHAGVPAGAMLRVAELPAFAYFAERGTYRLVTHPHLAEPFYRDAVPVRSHHLPPPADRPAPLLGEHTVAIAQSRLGLDEAAIAGLAAAGILELASLPRPAAEPIRKQAAHA